MRKSRLLLVSLVICSFLALVPVQAQQPIVITMTAPQYLSDLYEDTVIPAFEEAHPDIQVEFVFNEDNFFGNPIYEADSEESEYYQNVANYASSADVLYATSYLLSPFATETGFFLDLSPLVDVDSNLNEADFFPAAWQAFQWDRGIWALPYALSVQVLVYNMDAFDAAGWPYPDDTWTIVDYVAAAEALQTYNSNGEVELSPLIGVSPLSLFYNEVGPLFDETSLPAQPDLSSPELRNLLETLVAYDEAYEFAEFQGYSFNEIPMSLSYPYQLSTSSFGNEENVNWGVSLLPGEYATAQVEGFAISAGTANPEAAYELVSFITESIDVYAQGFTSTPARRSLVGTEPSEDVFISQPEFDPEVQAVIDRALEVAVAPSDMRYSEAFYVARTLMTEEGLDAESALEEVEQRISNLLLEAAEQQATTITVAQAEARRELAAGEIVLNFGMNNGGILNSRRQQWEDAVSNFTAENPTVADIDLDGNMYGPNGMDENIDCWYNSFGSSLNTATEPPEEWLSLDPLLSVDPDFNPDDFFPGILESLQIQGATYGYPLTVQPVVMWINPERFEEAGLPVPQGSWTVDAFNDALVTLAPMRENQDTPVVRDQTFGSNTIMMFITAYGGLPIDYSVDPPAYNLTTPESLAAMEQVVGYARDGLIAYPGLISNSSVFFGSNPEEEFIMIDVIGDQGFSIQTQDGLSEYPLQPVSFPTGTYTPVAYAIGMAQIQSTSPNIEPCYDWIRTMADSPELLMGMPAQQSLLEDPAFVTQNGEAVTNFYRELANTISAPNTVILPGIYGGVPSSSEGAWIEPNFFYKALDNVILEGADLETEMQLAEENIATFRDCISGIESLPAEEMQALFEEDQAAGMAYMRQFVDCAVTLLPELRNQYSFYYQEEE